MALQVDNATEADIRYVARAMRYSDLAEFRALLPVNTRSEMADLLSERYAALKPIVGRYGKEPICIGSVAEVRPNVGTLGFFATDKFPVIGLGVTRFIVKRLFPELRAGGMHRIECISHVEHEEAHKWIRLLGLSQETGVLRGFGKNREDFIQFAWVDDACKTGARH